MKDSATSLSRTEAPSSSQAGAWMGVSHPKGLRQSHDLVKSRANSSVYARLSGVMTTRSHEAATG